jgi:16S rRNA (cytosine967-C5)-methyltransferase
LSALSPAREIAFHILEQVHKGGYASDLLRAETSGLASRDAALAETIVFGCLRRQREIDFLIGHFSGKPTLKLDDAVRIALRMGVFQLRYLDRVPAHAVVTESVELVKKARKRSAAGFVNAVLRKVDREPVKLPDRSTELNVPAWMLKRWERRYGMDAAEGIARAALEPPEIGVNPDTGRIQDIGARAVVPLLGIEAGMTVLDVCSAPGNKTAQMLAAGARVVACDRYFRRLLEVPGGAQRVVADATMPLPFFGGSWKSGRDSPFRALNTALNQPAEAAKKVSVPVFPQGFDRVLVDAPCSGTGTLGRNPEIKWRLTEGDLAAFHDRQKLILFNAMACVAPGGKLVYATCSLEPEENENVVEGRRVEETMLRLPGREAGDGFFAAVIGG